MVSIRQVPDMTAASRAAKVLYVEDDPLTRQSISQLLTRRNLHVLQAESGEQAMEVLRDRPPLCAALLDLELPGMNGLETYHHLRSWYPALPIIICSAHLTVQRRRQLEDFGIPPAHLLGKPCPFAVLLAAIQNAIGNPNDQIP
jgi:CheY-like chemotaxis protein